MGWRPRRDRPDRSPPLAAVPDRRSAAPVWRSSISPAGRSSNARSATRSWRASSACRRVWRWPAWPPVPSSCRCSSRSGAWSPPSSSSPRSCPLVAVAWRGLTALDRRDLLPARGIALLRARPIFGPRRRRARGRRSSRRLADRSRPGRVVITEGEPGDRFYVMRRAGSRAARRPFLRDCDAGEGSGRSRSSDDVPRTATVTPTDGLALLAIDRAPFLAAVTATRCVRRRRARGRRAAL